MWVSTDAAGSGWGIVNFDPGLTAVTSKCRAHAAAQSSSGRSCKIDITVQDDKIAGVGLRQRAFEVRSLGLGVHNFNLNASLHGGVYTLRYTRYYDAYVNLDDLLLSLGNRPEVVCGAQGCDHIFAG